MQKKTLLAGLRAVLAAAAIVGLAPVAHAQATRTWVSGVGDDVNPCSRTAPCKTWVGAISKTAAGGEINALDSGSYGALTITKAITIDGAGHMAGILNTLGNGINVIVPNGTSVVIRNVVLQGVGTGNHGIQVSQGGDVHLENVFINNFAGQGVNFVPNDGAARLFMNNVSIRNAGAGAVLVKPGASATAFAMLDRVAMDANARGVRAEDGSQVTIANSHASGNDANGFVAMAVSGRPVEMSLESCVSAGNGAAGVHSGALATVRLSNTTVVRNLHGLVIVDGGQVVSAGNNRLLGNIDSNALPTSVSGQQ